MFRSGIYTIENCGKANYVQKSLQKSVNIIQCLEFLFQINYNQIKIDHTMANNSYRG